MSVLEQLTKDLTTSMKAQDAVRTGALRMAKAALMNRAIDKKAPLDDVEAVKVLQGLVKQREDSADQFRKGNRPELAAKEEQEIAVLKGYLPQDVPEAVIAAAVDQAVVETAAASPRDMGKVMKAALALLQAAGHAVDGKKVNEAAKKRLGG